MAREIRVILTDDIDGSADARAVEFSLDKAAYTIDLSEANIAKLEARLESEQTVIDTDAKAAAELELVLNTLKNQLTDKSALGDTIANMEKKLKYHKARVAVRTGVVGTLRKAIQGQHALRTQFAKITSK